MVAQELKLTISSEDLQKYKRLDLFLTEKIPDLSRNSIKKLFQEKAITSHQEILELKKMPPLGTEITVLIPKAKETDLIPQNIPIDIVYEDEYLLIVNKKAGMVVHPAPGNYDSTLVNAILYHVPDLQGIGHEKRPGIVHRLDKGTSGIMVVAKEAKAHQGLIDLFSKHDIKRKYQAIVLGNKIEPSGTIESTIGRNRNNRLKMQAKVKNGKKAITHYKVLDFFNKLSHLELTLETGRTHQIRVHLSQILGNPILNDPLYGQHKREEQTLDSKLKGLLKDYEYPLLHAKVLGFIHPITKKELFFEQEPPEIFREMLSLLKS